MGKVGLTTATVQWRTIPTTSHEQNALQNSWLGSPCYVVCHASLSVVSSWAMAHLEYLAGHRPTPDRTLFSSSPLRMANCKWCGMMQMLLSLIAFPPMRGLGWRNIRLPQQGRQEDQHQLTSCSFPCLEDDEYVCGKNEASLWLL